MPARLIQFRFPMLCRFILAPGAGCDRALCRNVPTPLNISLQSTVNEHEFPFCEKLTYISSAGLRVLLAAQKKTKGNMKLTKVCELVMEVFEMTGFADILVIE